MSIIHHPRSRKLKLVSASPQREASDIAKSRVKSHAGERIPAFLDRRIQQSDDAELAHIAVLGEK